VAAIVPVEELAALVGEAQTAVADDERGQANGDDVEDVEDVEDDDDATDDDDDTDDNEVLVEASASAECVSLASFSRVMCV